MKPPEYVTIEEVRSVCKETGIRDWTRLREAKATAREARIIQRHEGDIRTEGEVGKGAPFLKPGPR